MTAIIAKFILKSLCDNHGSLDFGSLNAKLEKSFTVAEEILRNVLFDSGRVAIHPSPGASRSIGPASRIVAKTSLRLCQRKFGDCRLCDGLHLCRYLVCGTCVFGSKCKNQHEVRSAHNVELLRKHDLQDLTDQQLFQLLLQNDPFLLPEICNHYNKGTCSFNDSCTKLHVCLHHVQGDCKFGPSCKRSHQLDVWGNKALQGFSQEMALVIYRNKSIISQQERTAPASPAVKPEVKRPPQLPAPVASHSTPVIPSNSEKTDICLYFIRKNCSYKEKCVRMHWHLPYRWQVMDADGGSWKDLSNMEEIEKAYCDPKHDTSSCESPSSITQFMRLLAISNPGVQSVDFISMTFLGSPVRRLSTASSASKPPHFVLTTEWVWYWEDDSGSWLEYGQSAEGTPTTVTSETLENLYLTDRESAVPFSTSRYSYVLHFKASPMCQENLRFKTRREVRRRPRFVSAHDVEVKLRSPGSGSSHGSNAADSFPPHWDRTNQPDVGYKMVPLERRSNEFIMIQKLFSVTMHQHRINSIHRIQNLSLWGIFHWQREQMKLRNGGKPVNEQYLFHGTDQALVEAICEQNFDWRMCGVHGTSYGKGSYFARDASYSNKYARAKGGRKVMFAALVLVGESAKGSSHYLRPPPRGNSNTLYDSCVDQMVSPSIYVIFEKQQIYPQYIIDYS
ncbi:protein mono-ADP-ribosyltransferase PARP12 [Synchiropus splendidus]|uniref:protein mono-ADP-ribosyltransferase PARP12 n=1 Tax=Synchiropus splendidus TaxID=270530 RepID=UPI00237D96A5|nr:protein mono-ADP-ribosyltransferase PARP12 [Synchiropus splendidus]